MAPLPNWILKNIVETMKKNPKHFERQEFASPGFNVELGPDYFKLWEEFDPLVKAFVEKGDMSDQAISNMIYKYLDGGVLGTGKEKSAQLSALYEIIRDNSDNEKFDSKLNLLHCTNKVIDLDTEELRDARPDDYLTKSTRLEYVPYEEHTAEKRALVEKFLDETTLGDNEMKKFLLKVLSSSLHGEIKFQFFFFFLGKGANGKSLLIKLMKKIFCDYHAPIPSSQVTKPGVNAQSSSPALMTLKGARGAFLTELQEPTLYT
ncbi:hypothetical protein HK104_006218 [Borealophlyctis nickersoniae]|nr:hypothetical protein HK104_006218 [Borealophlyctis nickersoniae]